MWLTGRIIGIIMSVVSHDNKNPEPTFKSTSISEFILFCFFISCIVKVSPPLVTNGDKIRQNPQ